MEEENQNIEESSKKDLTQEEIEEVQGGAIDIRIKGIDYTDMDIIIATGTGIIAFSEPTK